MLRKLFEWHRMVTPKPDNSLVENRTPAVTDLVSRISNAKTYYLLNASTAAAVHGLDGFEQQSELVQTVVDCIRAHQPAFPEDLSENALDLRACCAVAIGEVLTRDQSANSEPDTDAQLAASMIVPAIGLRPRVKQRYLQTVLDELHSAGLATLQRAAVARRGRRSLNFKKLEALKATAATNEAATDATTADINEKLTAFWQRVVPVLKESFTLLERQATMDREELEVLWWLYNGFSEQLEEPLGIQPPSTAAVCCGVEVANRVVLPPLNSLRQMVMQASEKNRKSADIVAKPLEDLIGQWETKVTDLLIPSDDEVQDFIRDYPQLLPLSWLCLRLHEGRHAPGWNQEFEVKTGVALSQSHKPSALAIQVFNERVAQRLYSNLVTQ